MRHGAAGARVAQPTWTEKIEAAARQYPGRAALIAVLVFLPTFGSIGPWRNRETNDLVETYYADNLVRVATPPGAIPVATQSY